LNGKDGGATSRRFPDPDIHHQDRVPIENIQTARRTQNLDPHILRSEAPVAVKFSPAIKPSRRPRNISDCRIPCRARVM
jgi:hypothetical protein